jgi:acyl carrier protein
MIRRELKEILINVLEVGEHDLHIDTGSHNTRSWDSFARLLIAAEIEKTFELKLSVAEINAVVSIRDISEILQSRGITIIEDAE